MEAGVVACRWRSLPTEVVAEVERRRAGVLAGARAPVLDLDEPEVRARISTPGPMTNDPAARGGRPATIVCTCALIEEPDLGRAMGRMAELMADDGELRLIEPVNWAGLWGLLASSAGSALPAVAGLHLSRDVVAAVRAAGLTVADLDRFEMPTRIWPLRRFVELRAVRISRAGAGS